MKMKNKIVLIMLMAFGISQSIQAQCTAMNAGSIDYLTTANSVTFSWLNDPNAANYTIAYGTNGYNPNLGGLGSSENTSNTFLTVSSLTTGTVYNFWFRTNCSNGSNSIWVGPLNITPSLTLCGNVSNLSNTSLTGISANFTWIGPPEANSYEIKYGLTGFNVNTEGTLLTSSTASIGITGLTQDITYQVYVRSVCAAGSSNWSAPFEFTTTDIDNPVLVKSGGKLYTGSYRPNSNVKYVLSAWVKEVETGVPAPPTYTNSSIGIYLVNIDDESETPFTITGTVGVFQPSGRIIDGWQRIQEVFVLPAPLPNIIEDQGIQFQLMNTSQGYVDVYFDDIRVFPFNGNMKSFVYDDATKKLMAELDENNYATYYEYDKEGGLVRVKKETEKGIYTLQETRSSNVKN